MRSFILMLIAMAIVSIASAPVIIINMIRKACRRESVSEYLFTIAIGFDQAGGSILYEQEDWTVSSWTYYLYRNNDNPDAKRFMLFVDWFFGPDHCKNSFIKEAEKQNFCVEWK